MVFLAAFHPAVAETSQKKRISLSCEDGIEYLETADACDVIQDTMNLKVHLIQGLLHM